MLAGALVKAVAEQGRPAKETDTVVHKLEDSIRLIDPRDRRWAQEDAKAGAEG